jgi:hypothetical protein
MPQPDDALAPLSTDESPIQTNERKALQSILEDLTRHQEILQHITFRIGQRVGTRACPVEAAQALNGAVDELKRFLDREAP